MKKIKLFEEFAVNESSKFKVKDIKIGTVLNFKDGETWKVTGFIGKPNDPRGVFASPYGRTTDNYTSVALEFTIAELEKGVKSLDESMVVEAKDFAKMALEILGDISQEFDPWEIRDMLPQDAFDTVDAYYPKWSSVDKKKLARELMDYADQPDQWITEAVSEAKKFKAGQVWLWKHVDGDKEVEITNIKPNGDVVGKVKGTSDEFTIRDAGKWLKKKVNEANVVLDGSWVDTKELNWVNHTRVIKWIHNELDNKATMTKDGRFWSIDTSKLMPRQIKNLIDYLRSQKLLREARNVTEAKTLGLDDMMIHLEDKYNFSSVRPSEEFNGSQGGIWVSGENGETLGGKRIYDYYASGAAYELGVLKKYEQAINKLGWYSEWYDAGTVMIWPN
jgi:hypothetical protein